VLNLAELLHCQPFHIVDHAQPIGQSGKTFDNKTLGFGHVAQNTAMDFQL